MAAKKLDREQVLIKAMAHPLRAWLLRICLEAAEPKSPKGLALETHRGKGSFQKHLSNVSYHVRTLAEYGALEIVTEEPRRGSVAHFYRPTELVRGTLWVLAALGLSMPPCDGRAPCRLSDEDRARMRERIEERRKDPEFMERLNQRIEEDRPVLEAIRKSEEEDEEATQSKKP